ncbi:MAG: enoyl-CoA hydratase [Acidobacteriota bacterium]|nr:enoyl-CoA hydratase [Acidobacteriota bacterium]
MPEAEAGIVRRGPAVRVEMRWPEKRNALSVAMMDRLAATLREGAGEEGARAIVLAGAAPAFSAGHYLPEMVGTSPEQQRRIFTACSALMDTIRALPLPVIAEVRGIATAAGCQLVAACDLAVAADAARFATPGVRIGLFCSTPMVPVSRAVGSKRAMEMLLTGDFVDAQTALDWGLVNRVVPEEQLEDETQSFVERIAEASPFVVALGKRAFHRQVGLSVEDAYAAMSEVMCENAVEPDAQEGMRAFLEKRQPRWTQSADS